MEPISVRNPRTGKPDYTLHPSSPSVVGDVCTALRQAQPAWNELGLARRVAIMRRWADAIRAAREPIVAAVMNDTGRWRESQMEVDAIPRMIDRWCEQAPALLEGRPRHASSVIPSIQIEADPVPYGVVGVISPWNFPLLLSLIDTVPALLAGCAVAVKPSEVTPRFADPLTATIGEVPELASILRILQGTGTTGASLVENVDAICFTGSVPTGRKVAEAAARCFIPAFLELGGKDPAIVLESADLDRTAAALLSGSVTNAGQACQSLERIYVARPIHDRLVDSLVDRARRMRLSWPDPTFGEIGPIIFDRQAAIIRDHVEDALAKGARVLSGGVVEDHGGGAWVRPTVIVDVHHGMKVMRDESFGPLMPVMAFDTVEEAVCLANDSQYGLSAAVFAATEAEARPVAAQLQVGAVSINDAALTAFVYDAEKNSFKLSGLGGSRMGPSGLTRFLRHRAVLINSGRDAAPWWLTSH